MKRLFLLAMVVIAPLFGGDGEDPNVNAKYIVEGISIAGWKNLVSTPLKSEMDQVVGGNLDHSKLDQLASRLKHELHVAEVAVKITKGSMPDHVLVTFEVTKTKEQTFDLKVAKFLYDSKQGWSGQGSATTTIHGNAFTFGL